MTEKRYGCIYNCGRPEGGCGASKGRCRKCTEHDDAKRQKAVKSKKHVVCESVEEFQAALRDSWSEEEFTAAVIALAHDNHFHCVHMRPARTDKGWRTAGIGDIEGWPDIAAAKIGYRNVFLELKVRGNKPTEKQLTWLSLLNQGGALCMTMWPRDWETVVDIFAGEAALLPSGSGRQ